VRRTAEEFKAEAAKLIGASEYVAAKKEATAAG
jgi:hypothetical protein